MSMMTTRTTMMLAFCAMIAISTGLLNKGGITYSITVPKPCSGRISSRCCPKGPCQIRYSLKSSLTNLIDKTTSSKNQCANACGKHYETCENICNLLASDNDAQKRDSKVCKCVRDESMWWSIYSKCVDACKKGGNGCMKNCEIGSCPIVAEAKVSFSMLVNGSCSNFCVNRRLGASTVKKVCHA